MSEQNEKYAEIIRVVKQRHEDNKKRAKQLKIPYGISVWKKDWERYYSENLKGMAGSYLILFKQRGRAIFVLEYSEDDRWCISDIYGVALRSGINKFVRDILVNFDMVFHTNYRKKNNYAHKLQGFVGNDIELLIKFMSGIIGK